MKKEDKTINSYDGVDDKEILLNYINKLSKNGWIINSRDNKSAQLTLKKRWSMAGLLLSFVLAIFGIGILLFLFCVIDYLIKKDKVIFITVSSIKSGEADKMVNTNSTSKAIFTVFIIFVIFISCFINSIIKEPASNKRNLSAPSKVKDEITIFKQRQEDTANNKFAVGIAKKHLKTIKVYKEPSIDSDILVTIDINKKLGDYDVFAIDGQYGEFYRIFPLNSGFHINNPNKPNGTWVLKKDINLDEILSGYVIKYIPKQ